MGKKIKYGDLRKMDLDFDILDEVKLAEYENKRKEFAQLLDSYEMKRPVAGEVSNLTYLGVTEEFFIFDGGFKDYVRIENRPNEAKYFKNTNVGDQVDVLIVSVDEMNYFIKGSLVELYENKARKSLIDLDDTVPVDAFVRELTPAGYNVDILFEGVTLAGFMPNTLAGINKLSTPESIVGKTFLVMIESFSKDEGTYIVSRRKYLQTLIPDAIKDLEYNVVYTGIVTGTTQFGIFVEFKDCLTGMIHKTNINPELLEQYDQVVPGLEIEFFIKEIIREKIILTQVVRDSLWDTIRVGQIIPGKVRDMKSFGALVILDEETNGLIHTSELEKTSRKLNSGDEVRVRIIAIDRMSRKIFLTLV